MTSEHIAQKIAQEYGIELYIATFDARKYYASIHPLVILRENIRNGLDPAVILYEIKSFLNRSTSLKEAGSIFNILVQEDFGLREGGLL